MTKSKTKTKTSLTIDRATLANAIAKAFPFAATRNTGSNVDCFKVEVSADVLTITAFNGDRAIEINIDCQSSDKMSACIPARMLRDVVSILPAGDVRLSFDDGFCHVKTQTTNHKIATRPDDLFPVIPWGKDTPLTLSVDAIRAISICSEFVKQNAAGSVLNGVFVDLGSGSIYASDGHRIAKASTTPATAPSMVVDGVLASTLSKIFMDDGVTLFPSPELVTVQSSDESIKLFGRLLQGTYPALHQLIPKQYTSSAVTDADEMMSAIRSAVVMSARDPAILTASINASSLTLFSEESEIGCGDRSIECQYTADEYRIGFNASYLESALSVFGRDSTVQMSFNSPTALFRVSMPQDESVEIFIMPCNIKE